MFLHAKPRPDANSVRGLGCKDKAFYSPETQHGRRVRKAYVQAFENIGLGSSELYMLPCDNLMVQLLKLPIVENYL